MRYLEESEFYFRAWRESGQLSSSSFLGRMTNQAERLTLSMRAAQMSNLDRVRDAAAPQAYLRDMEFLPAVGVEALERAGPVFSRMLAYLSRYPFLPPPGDGEAPTFTPHGLLRAIVLAVSDTSDRFLISGSGSLTRAHTPADHHRMLFQGLATPRDRARRALAPADEQRWRANADRRAHEFSSAESEEFLGDCARTNRTDDGDEIFHDLVGIMALVEPDGPYQPPNVPRDAFIPLAKELVAKDGLCPDPLHCFALARSDFSALVQLLLVMDLVMNHGLEGEDPLPHDFNASRDHIVEAFFGDDGDEIDFEVFHSALTSGGTPFPGLLKQLDELVNMFLWVAPEHRKS